MLSRGWLLVVTPPSSLLWGMGRLRSPVGGWWFGLREEISMNEEAALYRARVEVYDVGLGEWRVTAEAVDTLEGLVSWASLGVGVKSAAGPGASDPFFGLVAEAQRALEPPYGVEDVVGYIRGAFALSGGSGERLSVVPVPDGESDTWHVLEAFMWREERGELGDEEREVWQRIADLFFRHPYGSYLTPQK